MHEDDSGTANLIAFPGKLAEASDNAPTAVPRERDLIRRLETIAQVIGVPVATFLGAAQERAPGAGRESGESRTARQSQAAELLRLSSRIGDGKTRDRCLALWRMLALSEPEAGRSS